MVEFSHIIVVFNCLRLETIELLLYDNVYDMFALKREDEIMFTKDVEEVLIRAGMEKELDDLTRYLSEYDNRYIRIAKPQEIKPKRLLGQNGLHYLQLALYRSKALLEGSIASLNSKNALVGILCTRAHFEVTGGLAYFYKKFNNFYKEKITYTQMEEALHRLTLGSRIGESVNDLTPINVMSLIEAADEFYQNKIPENVSMFKENYDFLSEFCHSNCNGIAMGCDINNAGIVRYNNLSVLKEKDLIFIHSLLMSCISFLDFYDMAYELLSSNEELPIIIK